MLTTACIDFFRLIEGLDVTPQLWTEEENQGFGDEFVKALSRKLHEKVKCSMAWEFRSATLLSPHFRLPSLPSPLSPLPLLSVLWSVRVSTMKVAQTSGNFTAERKEGK